MELREFASSDKATVVIQINPQMTQNTVISDDGQKSGGSNHYSALTGFLKAQPKALGTVQIMIGVVVFLFGILFTVLTVNHWILYGVSVLSGIYYWGSFIYIIAGSLSVAAQNKLHPRVVKASLGMNVFSAITAVIAIILMSVDMRILLYRGCNHYSERECSKNQVLTGIFGVLLVFSILQFFISICISGFASKATCNRDTTVINVALNQGY